MFIRSMMLTGVLAAIISACAAPTEAPVDEVGSTAEAITACTTAYSCAGHTSGYPDVVLTCKSPVNFFTHVNGSGPTYVETGTTYTTPANAVAHEIDACDLKDGTCAYFSNYEASATYCGTPPKVDPLPPKLNSCSRAHPTTKCTIGWRCCGPDDGWSCGPCI